MYYLISKDLCLTRSVDIILYRFKCLYNDADVTSRISTFIRFDKTTGGREITT